MRQRFRLAEMRCEDYFFVLLSRFINAVEGQVRMYPACCRPESHDCPASLCVSRLATVPESTSLHH